MGLAFVRGSVASVPGAKGGAALATNLQTANEDEEDGELEEVMESDGEGY